MAVNDKTQDGGGAPATGLGALPERMARKADRPASAMREDLAYVRPAGPGAAMHAPSGAEVITRIEAEARSLSAEEQRHLHSHVVTNAVGRINAETYLAIQVFKPLTIIFQNLRAGSKAFLTIQPDQRAIWAEGDESNRLVGLSIATDTDPALFLRSFLLNAREMYLQTYQDCASIQIQLFVRTEQSQVKGRVDLPPGSAVTLQSRNDRSTVIGLSSFSIDLA